MKRNRSPKCNRHMSSQGCCGEHFKGRLRSLSCISLLMYRVTLLTLFAGCEKHTPAHCAWCPFDFTPMNMLWIPPFCHFKRGSHGTDTHQFNGLVTQVGWQTSLGFIEEIYSNFGVFLGLAAFLPAFYQKQLGRKSFFDARDKERKQWCAIIPTVL